MNEQQLFNIALSIIGCVGGWFMKAMWESLKDLASADRRLSDDVNELKVLVAGQYVRHETFDKTMTALFVKLDRIEDRINEKVDRTST